MPIALSLARGFFHPTHLADSYPTANSDANPFQHPIGHSLIKWASATITAEDSDRLDSLLLDEDRTPLGDIERRSRFASITILVHPQRSEYGFRFIHTGKSIRADVRTAAIHANSRF
jgi:hypothetical protein